MLTELNNVCLLDFSQNLPENVISDLCVQNLIYSDMKLTIHSLFPIQAILFM